MIRLWYNSTSSEGLHPVRSMNSVNWMIYQDECVNKETNKLVLFTYVRSMPNSTVSYMARVAYCLREQTKKPCSFNLIKEENMFQSTIQKWCIRLTPSAKQPKYLVFFAPNEEPSNSAIGLVFPKGKRLLTKETLLSRIITQLKNTS